MVVERPVRRMTLRQRLTHSEKCTRDLIEHLQASLLPRVTEFRDLSRPVRRRSHYPTMVAMANGLRRLQQASEEALKLVEYLQEQLQDIREHARRERINRL
jgi:hypothetical protein